MWHPAKFQPTLQRRITSSLLRHYIILNKIINMTSFLMGNEMLKTVIPNVLSIYVMHILKQTFILYFALIGRYSTNQIFSNEKQSCTFQVQQYVAAPILICPDLNSVFALDKWTCQKGQKCSLYLVHSTSCTFLCLRSFWRNWSFFGMFIKSNFGGLKTKKIV